MVYQKSPVLVCTMLREGYTGVQKMLLQENVPRELFSVVQKDENQIR